MKRVLCTGAAGFVGKHLCRALHDRRDFVVGLLRDLGPDAGNTDSLDFTVLGSFEQVERAIAEYEIDTVVHLAAQVQVSTAVADPVGTLEANVRGTWQVLEACRRQHVKRVLLASSDKAYGDWIVPYSEAQPLVPHGVYATSKAMGDMLAQSYIAEYGMSLAITRCGNLYGPGHSNWSTLIPGTIRSVLNGERPVLRSNGGPQRDYLFIDDAIDGYLRLIDSDDHGPFNFGTGIGSSVFEVVEEIAKQTKTKLVPVVPATASGALEIKKQVVDWEKAERVLGWRPLHSLAAGLAKTIPWYREHRNG